MLGAFITIYVVVMFILVILLAKKWKDEPENIILVACLFWPITLILFILRVVVDLVQNEIILRFRKK